MIRNSKYTAHTTSISAWKFLFFLNKTKTKTMKILSSLPPSCLFCLYATVPAGEAGESPEHVKACSYRTEKLWEARCFIATQTKGTISLHSLQRWFEVIYESHESLFLANRNENVNFIWWMHLIHQSGYWVLYCTFKQRNVCFEIWTAKIKTSA